MSLFRRSINEGDKVRCHVKNDFMFIEQPDYQIIIDVSKNGDVIGVSWFKMPVESTSKEQINKICDILDKAKKIVINIKH